MKNREITSKVIRVHKRVLSATLAVIGGASLFLLTVLLLIKGGDPIGPHLNLLGQYLPGYRVSWPGSFIGFFWGALIGGVIGWIFGAVYNKVVDLEKK